MPTFFGKTTFKFPKGMPIHFAIMLCKEAQRMLSGVTGKYRVEHSNREDPTSQLIAQLSEVGADRLKRNLEELVQFHVFKKRNIAKQGLEFLAQQIMLENNYDVMYSISTCDDKYTSRIDVYGNEHEAFLNDVEKYCEDYLFDLPQVLTLIVMGKMKCKMSKEKRELVLVSCGPKTVVYPIGRKADEFYKEFVEVCGNLIEKEKDFEGTSDDILIEACHEINDIRDVYYYIKNSIVYLKGFEESINIFIATIPIMVDRVTKKKETRSSEPKHLEKKNPQIKDDEVEEVDEMTEEDLDEFKRTVSFGY